MKTRDAMRPVCAGGHRPPWARPPGDFVLVGAGLNLGYAAALIHALAQPSDGFSRWAAAWVAIGHRALAPAYVLAGASVCGGGSVSAAAARAWAFDINLIAVNLLVVSILTAMSWPSWRYWTRPDAPAGPWSSQDAATEAYGAMLWGFLAVLWWLLLENDQFDSSAHCNAFRPWMLLREPFLATVAHGFACFAAALRAKGAQRG